MKFPTKSLTQQHNKEQSDINYIVARAEKIGGIQKPVNEPVYADVSNMPDYQTAQNIIIDANNRFMQLPSAVRLRFNNNPSELIRFLQKAENIDEAEKLGLLTRRRNEVPENEEKPENPASTKNSTKKNPPAADEG